MDNLFFVQSYAIFIFVLISVQSAYSDLAWKKVNVNGDPLPTLWGHSITTDSYSKRVLLFGGKQGVFSYSNEIYSLVFESNTQAVWLRIETSGEKPSGRGMHSATITNNVLFIFGGASAVLGLPNPHNDLWSLDLDTYSWKQIEAIGEAPTARQGQCSVYVPSKNSLLVFGGNDGTRYLNDLFMYNIDTKRWSSITNMKGSAPNPRSSPSCVYSDDLRSMVLFGGENGQKSFNDLYLFDIDTLTWNKPTLQSQLPRPRHGHKAVLLGSSIFVAGGVDGSQYLNDLVAFDLQNFAWSFPTLVGEVPSERSHFGLDILGNNIVAVGGYDGNGGLSDTYTLTTDTTSLQWAVKTFWDSSIPSPRNGHAAAIVSLPKGDKFFVFGGTRTGKWFNDCLDDLYELDLTTMSWKSYPIMRDAPDKRYGHTATTTSDNRVIIFGGKGSTTFLSPSSYYNEIRIWSPERAVWTKAKINSNLVPSGRAFHTATQTTGNQMIVYGGYDGSNVLSDLYLLDIDSMEWMSPTVIGKPLSRSHHSAAYSSALNKIYYFGGEDSDGKLHNDVIVLDITKMMWSFPRSASTAPIPRKGHSASIVHKTMYIVGGDSGSRKLELNELWVYDIDHLTWSLHRITGISGGRMYHTSCSLGSTLYLFGGKDYNGQDKNDLLSVSIGTIAGLPNYIEPPISFKYKETGSTKSTTVRHERVEISPGQVHDVKETSGKVEKSQLFEVEIEAKDLLRKLQDFIDEDTSSHVRKIDEVSNEISNIEDRISLIDQLKQERQKIDELIQFLTIGKQKYDSQLKAIQSLITAKAKVENTIQSQKDQLKYDSAQKEGIETEMLQLKADLEEYQQLEKEVTESEHSQIEKMIEGLHSSKKELEKNLQDVKIQVIELDTQIVGLESSIQSYHIEIQAYKTKSTDLPKRRAGLEENKKSRETALAKLESSASSEITRRDGLVKAIHDKQKELDEIHTKHQKLRLLKEIMAEKEEISKMMLNFLEKVESVSKRSEEIMKELDLFSFATSDLLTTAEAKLAQQAFGETRNLTAFLHAYEAEINQRKSAIEEELKQLQLQLDALNTNMKEHDQSKLQILKDIETIELQIETLMKESTNYEIQQNKFQNSLETAQTTLQQKQSSRTQILETLKELESNLESIDHTLKQRESEARDADYSRKSKISRLTEIQSILINNIKVTTNRYKEAEQSRSLLNSNSRFLFQEWETTKMNVIGDEQKYKNELSDWKSEWSDKKRSSICK